MADSKANKVLDKGRGREIMDALVMSPNSMLDRLILVFGILGFSIRIFVRKEE